MKKLSKTKVVIMSLFTIAFLLSLTLLGLTITRNQAAEDSSASTEPKCIGFDYNDNAHCAAKSADTTKACNDPSFRMQKSARTKCCTFNEQTNTCSNITQNEPRLVSACAGFQCTGSTRFHCLAGPELIALDVCTDNFKFQYPTTPLEGGNGAGTFNGTQGEEQACSRDSVGQSNCLSGLFCCPCTSGGYKCGGKNKTCSAVCSASGGTVDTSVTPAPGGGSTSTPACTPVKPAVAKLIGPRNKTEITEPKVTISWEKNGTFGKECRDNGKPNRFILKYAIVKKDSACPAFGIKYKGRQLIEKVANQKKYSVEISDLKDDRKYCWFIRTKNGETKAETKVRSFTTKFAVPEVNEDGGEDLVVKEGSTTVEVVSDTE